MKSTRNTQFTFDKIHIEESDKGEDFWQRVAEREKQKSKSDIFSKSPNKSYVESLARFNSRKIPNLIEKMQASVVK